jgi:hypothetical protein
LRVDLDVMVVREVDQQFATAGIDATVARKAAEYPPDTVVGKLAAGVADRLLERLLHPRPHLAEPSRPVIREEVCERVRERRRVIGKVVYGLSRAASACGGALQGDSPRLLVRRRLASVVCERTDECREHKLRLEAS